jgi:hypothetical protein
MHGLVSKCIESAVYELDQEYIGNTVQFDEGDCNGVQCSIFAIGGSVGCAAACIGTDGLGCAGCIALASPHIFEQCKDCWPH